MISDEIKRKIIFLFENTRLKYDVIQKEISLEEEIDIEDIFNVLTEYQKFNKESIVRSKKVIEEQLMEELFKLRENGYTYIQISEYICSNKGIKLSEDIINLLVDKIYKMKKKKNPNIEKIVVSNIEERIFELREARFSYQMIVEDFKNRGIDISYRKISEICKIIYASKGKEEPKAIYKTQKNLDKNKVYELRKQGYTYKEISQFFYTEGILISVEKISRICKSIFREKGEIEPELKGNKNIEIDLNIVKELRKKEYSYSRIAYYFEQNGIQVSLETIRKYFISVYGKDNFDFQKDYIRERIFELRENGFGYSKIASLLKEEGYIIFNSKVKQICKEIYKEKGKEIPKTIRKGSSLIYDSEIYELREKGLSHKSIAQYFTDHGRYVSLEKIRRRCKKIYESMGKEQPKIKTGRKNKFIDNEELCMLRRIGLSYQKIEKYYAKKGTCISFNQIRTRYMQISEHSNMPKESKSSEKTKNKRNIHNSETIKIKILELKQTKSATDEQLRIIAELYGISLEEIELDNKEI